MSSSYALGVDFELVAVVEILVGRGFRGLRDTRNRALLLSEGSSIQKG